MSAVLLPRVLLEFYAVVTNPRRVPAALTPESARARIAALRSGLPMLDVRADALGDLATLVADRQPVGPSIYDLFLVAQMQSHNVATICTYNVADFSGFRGVQAILPESLDSRTDER